MGKVKFTNGTKVLISITDCMHNARKQNKEFYLTIVTINEQTFHFHQLHLVRIGF